MATTKEELPVLGIKASGNYIRHIAVMIREVAVTCRYSTNVVRNFKFLTPFFVSSITRITTSYYLRTVVT